MLKKILFFLRWGIVSVVLLFALAAIISADFVPGILLLILSFLISPLSSKYLFNKLSFKTPNWAKLILVIAVFIGFAATLPQPKNKTENNKVLSSQTALEKQSENQSANTSEIITVEEKPTVSSTTIPTSIPTAKPTPSWFDGKEKAKVVNVIDGDTIKLDNGKVVRYIGIDTPETVSPSKPVQCFGKEASIFNENLVEGKEVWLEKDVSETDKYNRLLRYVYVLEEGEDLDKDGLTFVNKLLVAKGYAFSSSYPPDIKYQEDFRILEQEARNNKEGLWADNACPTPTLKPVVQVKPTAAQIIPTSRPTAYTVAPPTQNQGGWACNCSKTCPNMSSCAEAQYQLNACGCGARDADKDGIACDADCQ